MLLLAVVVVVIGVDVVVREASATEEERVERDNCESIEI